MKFKYLYAVFIIVVVFMNSCTPYKSVPYFQDLKKTQIYSEQINNASSLTIQPGDLLAVHVTSLNKEADAPFNYNLNPITPNAVSGIQRQEQESVFGYLVDSIGNIHMPLVGAIKVIGLSTVQIQQLLELKLSEYLSKPNVQVRLDNFKVSVLGDVAHPGVYSTRDERMSVVEALALAGDLNTTGIRDSVLLIREFEGKRQFVPLSMTSKGIFNSHYFYLKNNDVIYVQPNRDRVSQSDSGLAKASVIISALSVVALILTRIL